MKPIVLSILVATLISPSLTISQERDDDRISRAEAALSVLDRVDQKLPWFSVKCKDITQKGNLLQMRGNVELLTPTVIIQADEADYNLDTHQLEPRGNVRVRERQIEGE